MLVGHTTVWDVRGGGGTAVHGQGGVVLRPTEKTDNLPRLHSRTYRGIDDGAQTADAWDGYSN